MSYVKKVLPNRLRILCEDIPHFHTASIGVWVRNGSRHESARLAGISHFIEHMVFKGTEKMPAADLAAALDRIGGNANAYTTKENTCFYMTCLSRNLRTAADLLCEMLLNPALLDDELESERGVIFEEISMYEDTPEDLVAEILSIDSLKGSPAGRPILGTKAALNRIDPGIMRDYMRSHYTGSNMIVSVCGNFTDSDIDYIAGLFSAFPAGKVNSSRKTLYTPAFSVKRKDIEQAHIALRWPAITAASPERFSLRLLNTIFGDGMSSRLFQRVREKEGACYSVCGVPAALSDAGFYDIYTATSCELLHRTEAAIRDEIERLLSDGVTHDELDRARDQTEAGMLISLEGSGARMSQLARCELLYGTFPNVEETLERYSAVTCEDVLCMARKVFVNDCGSAAYVGNLPADIK